MTHWPRTRANSAGYLRAHRGASAAGGARLRGCLRRRRRPPDSDDHPYAQGLMAILVASTSLICLVALGALAARTGGALSLRSARRGSASGGPSRWESPPASDGCLVSLSDAGCDNLRRMTHVATRDGSMKHQARAPQPRNGDRDIDESMAAAGFRVWPTDLACDAINLDSCVAFERIAVRTRGRVRIPKWSSCPGPVERCWFAEVATSLDSGIYTLAESTCGGSAIRVRTMEWDCQLELPVDGMAIVTSTIDAVSRVEPAMS